MSDAVDCRTVLARDALLQRCESANPRRDLLPPGLFVADPTGRRGDVGTSQYHELLAPFLASPDWAINVVFGADVLLEVPVHAIVLPQCLPGLVERARVN